MPGRRLLRRSRLRRLSLTVLRAETLSRNALRQLIPGVADDLNDRVNGSILYSGHNIVTAFLLHSLGDLCGQAIIRIQHLLQRNIFAAVDAIIEIIGDSWDELPEGVETVDDLLRTQPKSHPGRRS